MGKSKQRTYGKKSLLFLCFGLVLMGGCAKAEALSNSLLIENTTEDSAELTEGMTSFEELKKENIISDTGELKSQPMQEQKKPEPEIDTTGKVQVTFANNSLLDVFYYSDADLQQPLNTENCYLEPNACIYASVPTGKNEFSNRYSFENFRIYQYDAAGKKSLTETVSLQEGNLVYQIPMLADGYGISIVPVGQYMDREVLLSDYVLGNNGEKTELSGKWVLNNKEYYNGNVAISSLSSYVVSYEYDKEAYYFVSATPENACHYPKDKGNAEGEVIFKNQEPESAAESFSVELHKYLSATIDNKAKGLLYVKVKDRGEEIAVDSKMEINKLKCGSVIEIKTDKVHKLDAINVDMAEPTEVDDGYVYTVVVPEVAEARLNLSVLSWDQKTIGITVDKSTSTSWWEKLIGGNKKEESILMLYTGDNSYTYEDLQKGKEVVLSEHDDLEISVSRKLPEGSQVHIVIDNTETFIVKADSTEFRKTLDYDDVSTLRIVIQNAENENANQKTKLTVVLDKSLDSNILFSVDASGKNIVKEAGYIKDKETIYNDAIDAEQNIVISARNMQLYANKAIKLKIEKDDNTSEIRYVKGMNLEETISTQLGEGYSGAVKITISMVNYVTYKAHSGENYSVELKYADADKRVLKDGDILEEDRKIVMTMTADEGYYMDSATGQGWWREGDAVYEREMKYSDYVAKLEEIIEKNPVKKLITVTLDGSAPYQSGTVTYEINGDSMEAGTYQLKEGDEIKLTFKVAEDSGYQIVNDNIFSFINKYVDKKSETIKVSYEMESSTIRVVDYMTVEKKEN